MTQLGNEIMKRIGRIERIVGLPDLHPTRNDTPFEPQEWLCGCQEELWAAWLPAYCPDCGEILETPQRPEMTISIAQGQSENKS